MKLTSVSGFKYPLQAGLFIIASVALVACGGSSNNSGSARYSPSNGQGTLNPPPSATGNSIPIVLDAGPRSSATVINIPYVSVTVCTPGATGTTAACQTINHVVLDTGSFGLRLLNSALYTNLNLPAVINGNGRAIGECLPFAAGTTWGSVQLADIYLAGEVARSVPIQVIGGKPGGAATIPTDCSGTGTITDDQASLGANGILGIGLFTNDCDACLRTPIIPAAYYACTSQGCANTTVTQSQVVKNPVALFSQDNNGTLIVLPSVPSVGVTGSVTGTLIFGIGTQPNNALNSAIAYPADAFGNIQTTYNNAPSTKSFIDSGSNALFFSDASIATCSNSTWAYCPAVDPTALSATNVGAAGTPSALVHFSIVNLQKLSSNVVAANIGGTALSSQFDWGLPFFFGRPVFTAIAGATTPSGPGPYWAY